LLAVVAMLRRESLRGEQTGIEARTRGCSFEVEATGSAAVRQARAKELVARFIVQRMEKGRSNGKMQRAHGKRTGGATAKLTIRGTTMRWQSIELMENRCYGIDT